MPIDALWHLRGSVALDSALEDEAALDRIEDMLDRQRKQNQERGSDFVAFVGGFNSGFNWLALVIYDRGVFWIVRDAEGRRLRYRLRSLYGFILSLFAGSVAFTFGVVDGSVSRGLLFGGLAFAWLYGTNLFLAAMRVPGLIERTLSGA